MEQVTMFDLLYDNYTIKKPIRLIELFAGYGSQNLALKYLGANYKHHKIVEWAVKSIEAYNDIHIRDYKDYSSELSDQEVLEYLVSKGISMDYNQPMTKEQISRKSVEWQRKVYNDIIATNNLVDISRVHAEDLEIRGGYEYIMTYSFPCQDLSLAGKGKGMSKDSGTRSGLLWQVERILLECEKLGTLPNILIMENVPEVKGSNNIHDFTAWVRQLERLGYSNYCDILNAKDYGIPQNRRRCFMVSILGEWNYKMPKPMKLKYRLKDFLEKDVDERFYLSNKNIQYIVGNALNPSLKDYLDRGKAFFNKDVSYALNTKSDRRIGDSNYILDDVNEEIQVKDVIERIGNYSPSGHHSHSIVNPNGLAPTVMENHGQVTAIPIKNATKEGYIEATEGDGIDISSRMEYHRGTVQKGMAQTLTCVGGENVGVVVKEQTNPSNDLRIRKLTPTECFRLMGVKDEDSSKVKQSDASKYHLAGDSIVTTCLMGLFGELLGIDYKSKIRELADEIARGEGNGR